MSQLHANTRIFSRFAWLTVAMAMVGLSGCGALTNRTASSGVGSDVAKEAAPESDPKATCVVAFSSRGKAKSVTVPMDGPVPLDKLVAQVGGFRFRKSEVTIYRAVPGQPRPIRLKVQMEDGSKIKEEFNYAVHPGDRILVKEDTTTTLDVALKKIGLGW